MKGIMKSSTFSWKLPVDPLNLENNKCFICLECIEAKEETRESELYYSLRNLFRVLCINITKIKANFQKDVNLCNLNKTEKDVKVVLCNKCSTVNGILSKYVIQLESAALQINYCLKEITKAGAESTAKLNSTLVDQLRTQVLNKCSTFTVGPSTRVEISKENINELDFSKIFPKDNNNYLPKVPVRKLKGFSSGICNLYGGTLTSHNDKFHLKTNFTCFKCNKKCSDRWKYKRHIQNCVVIKKEIITEENEVIIETGTDIGPLENDFTAVADSFQEGQDYDNDDNSSIPVLDYCGSQIDDQLYSNIKIENIDGDISQLNNQEDNPEDNKSKTNKPTKNIRELCPFCNKSFLQLKSHIAMVHQKIRSYSCAICNLSFKKSSHLTDHNDKKHLKIDLRCKKCNKKCANRWKYKSHLMKCDRNAALSLNFEKPKVLSIKSSKKTVVTRTKKRQRKYQTVNNPDNLKERRYSCDKCDKTFKKSSHLTYHNDKLHLGKTFVCATCNKKCGDRWKYKSHLENCGKITETESPTKKEEPAFCIECNREFRNKNQLQNHLKTTKKHGKSVGYQCEFCEKSLMSRSSMEYHQALVHYKELNIQPFQCQFCEQILGNERALDNHIRSIHTKQTNLKCAACNLAFVYKYMYDRHIVAVHEKEKLPFQCAECPKTLSSLFHLKNHMRMHTGEKPYECQQCGKKFSDNPTYRRHLESHGDQVYNCEVCKSNFKVWHSYRLHMKKHNILVNKKDR